MTDYPRFMGHTLVNTPEEEAAIWATWNAEAEKPAPVTGLHEASFGDQTNEVSGKAIIARKPRKPRAPKRG